MISAYHRPQTLAEALSLITRKTPPTYPLGGGTMLAHTVEEDIEVVDLQALGLNQIQKSGNGLEVGATVTLQVLLTSPELPGPMPAALSLEAPLNMRNSATTAGTIVTCDGRSTFTTALLALDAKVVLQNPAIATVSLGDFLAMRRRLLPGSLITRIHIPLQVRLAFEYAARTPADKPIVCVALAQWPSGRTRLAVGGYGLSPLVAMDGTEPDGMEMAARNALHEASDAWGSAEYRMDVAGTLARRCLDSFKAE